MAAKDISLWYRISAPRSAANAMASGIFDAGRKEVMYFRVGGLLFLPGIPYFLSGREASCLNRCLHLPTLHYNIKRDSVAMITVLKDFFTTAVIISAEKELAVNQM